jgi:hypothetical protein
MKTFSLANRLLLTLLLESGALAQGTEWKGGNMPFADKRDLDASGLRTSAILAVGSPVVRIGETCSAEFRLKNTGDRAQFYNPFLEQGIPLPAKLAVYDERKNCLGDVFSSSSRTGSRYSVTRANWVVVPSRASVGTSVTFRLTGLEVGTYFIQAIWVRSLLAEPGSDVYSHFDSTELFRSNPVKITVTK